MDTNNQDDALNSPGAGAGTSNNTKVREMVQQALEKEASHPGNAEHAAGMHGKKPQDGTAETGSLDWGDTPPSARINWEGEQP